MSPAKQAMLVLRFDTESAAALLPADRRCEDRWADWIEESLAGVAVVCDVLKDLQAPGSFFLVGQLLARAGGRYAGLLAGNSRFDVGNHTYNHWKIWRPDREQPMDRFRRELGQTAELIEEHFGSTPQGFTAPGCFHRGLLGRADQLQVLWGEGYRYITTDGQPDPEVQTNSPAPFTQPYWYESDGFGDLLEVPLTGWHCNMLFNSGGQNDDWQPAPGLPDARVVERPARTPEEGFEIRRAELQYAIEHRLVYSPCMHPWSIYRADPQMEHLRRLIRLALDRQMPIVNCRDVYELYCKRRCIK